MLAQPPNNVLSYETILAESLYSSRPRGSAVRVNVIVGYNDRKRRECRALCITVAGRWLSEATKNKNSYKKSFLEKQTHLYRKSIQKAQLKMNDLR